MVMQPAGGLIISLKEHFEALLAEAEKRNGQRFDAQQEAVTTALNAAKEAVTAAMSAAEKAVAKAETAADKRLDGLNELRQMALDWKTEFARQTTVDLQIKNVSDRLSTLENARQETSGKSTGQAQVGEWVRNLVIIAIGIGAIVIPLLVHRP
jgi:hypothetical protein